MDWGFDTQWLVIAVVAMVVVGLPIITSRVALPAVLVFQEVLPDEMTPKQTDFFSSTDTALNRLGYRPFTTFRATNLSGSNLNRAYTSSSEPTRILVTLISGPGGTIAMRYTEMITKYQDGTILSTKNSEVSTVFATLPGRVAQVFAGIDDLEELKRRHDAKAATLVSRSPIHRDDAKFFDDFQEHHRRFCEYQRERKLLHYDGRAGLYRATVWTGLRGIRNFLNPFADNFTWPRFAAVMVFSLMVPVVALFERGPMVAWMRTRIPLDPGALDTVLLGLAFAVGGAVVGYHFRQKSFIWAFLLGFISTRLIGATGRNDVLFCIWMAMVAEIINRWRTQRVRLV